ncbi:hypothetical protein HDU97_005770 [Phlyctochytrium planicorne]|nr:hypothetical protein HDU97_005770 [Phlyctochytrium planicorne]
MKEAMQNTCLRYHGSEEGAVLRAPSCPLFINRLEWGILASVLSKGKGRASFLNPTGSPKIFYDLTEPVGSRNEHLATFYNATLYNYSFGGAFCNVTSSFPPPYRPNFSRMPEFPKQLGLFFSDNATRSVLDPQSTLYSVFVGGNDYIAQLALGLPFTAPGVVSTILNGISQLVATTNAKYITTWTIGNLSGAPITQPFLTSDAKIAALKALENQHNQLLAEGLEVLKKTTNITIFLTPIETIFDSFGPSFGLSNYEEPCLVQPPIFPPPPKPTTTTTPPPLPTTTEVTGTTAANRLARRDYTVCSDPNSHQFWDDIHPSAIGHKILAEATKNTIEQYFDNLNVSSSSSVSTVAEATSSTDVPTTPSTADVPAPTSAVDIPTTTASADVPTAPAEVRTPEPSAETTSTDETTASATSESIPEPNTEPTP